MIFRRLSPFALLYGVVALPQDGDTSQGAQFTSPAGKRCPVEVRTRSEVPASLVTVEQGKQSTEGQGLHLTLDNVRPTCANVDAQLGNPFTHGLNVSRQPACQPLDPSNNNAAYCFIVESITPDRKLRMRLG
ncbi:MAG: hypothetical protein ABR905_07855 [Terracidiphilus sp.]